MRTIIIMVNGIIIILTILIMGKIIGKIKIKTMIKKALLVIAILGRIRIIMLVTIVANTFQKFSVLLIEVSTV